MRVSPLLAGLAFATAGCSAAPAPAPTVPIETPAPSSAPAATPSTAQQPVGSTQESIDEHTKLRVTVLRIRQPLASSLPPERPGFQYAGVEVRMCVVENTHKDPVSLGWGPWAMLYADDTMAQSATSWSPDTFSVPLYPTDRIVQPGRCARGWIPFEVRKGSKPKYIAYGPSGTSPLEWAVK